MLPAFCFHTACRVNEGFGSGTKAVVGGQENGLHGGWGGVFSKLCAHPQDLLESQSGLTRKTLGIPAWHQRTTLPHPRPCSSGKPLPESAPGPTLLELSLSMHQASHLPAASSNCHNLLHSCSMSELLHQ